MWGAAETPNPMGSRRPSPRFVIGGAVIAAAAAYLVFAALDSTAVYYLTVAELRAGSAPAGKVVRLGGDVAPGTIVREGAQVRFALADGGGDLPVVYRGVVPDIFAENVQVVVEGRPGADGTFVANQLLTKCPSKFEASPEPGNSS